MDMRGPVIGGIDHDAQAIQAENGGHTVLSTTNPSAWKRRATLSLWRAATSGQFIHLRRRGSAAIRAFGHRRRGVDAALNTDKTHLSIMIESRR